MTEFRIRTVGGTQYASMEEAWETIAPILAELVADIVLETERKRRGEGAQRESTERETTLGLADREWQEGHRESNVAD